MQFVDRKQKLRNQSLFILYSSRSHIRVGHGFIFADPIESNPKIAGIKDNS